MNRSSAEIMKQFNRINDKISLLYHKASRKLGLSDSEMSIFYLLCDYGTLSQKEIIGLTGMSKQTMSSAVGRMEAAGWLSRGVTAGHRRDLILTEKGQAVVDDVLAPFMEQENRIFETWTEEEKTTFLSLNARYRDELERIVNGMTDRQKGG